MIAASISGLRSRTMADGRCDRRLLALANQLGQIRPLECALAGEQLVEHEAERVDVAADRDLAAGELLGRHVGRRAGAKRFACDAGETEVGDAHASGGIEHHVRGFEIPMDDVALVRGGEAGADLPRDLESALLGESADPSQQRATDPRRPRIPSTGTCALRLRRCRRRGRRSDATPGAPCALRCAVVSGVRDPDRRPAAETSARPADRASGRRRERPRPCRRGRGVRRCDSGRRECCRAESVRGRSRRRRRAIRWSWNRCSARSNELGRRRGARRRRLRLGREASDGLVAVALGSRWASVKEALNRRRSAGSGHSS